MKEKKEKFFDEMISYGCAVLVGPVLEREEIKFVKEAPLLLVDGGFDIASKSGLLTNRSHFSVGDGDSSMGPLDHDLPSEKDYSDLAFAMSLIPHSVKNILLLGFLGGRKDHEICNLGEVHQYLRERNTEIMVNFSGSILSLSAGKWSLESENEFSLMAFDRPKVILKGDIKYQILEKKELPPFSSLGLSNLGSGNFQLENDGPVFFYGRGIKVKSE